MYGIPNKTNKFANIALKNKNQEEINNIQKALPENWIILKDKKSGKIFYYNEKTRRRKIIFP